MKKILSLTLAMMLLAAMAAPVYAAETTLTTTVPAATYTLNIPANQAIPFGATETNSGQLTVTSPNGFAEGKNLKVTLSYEPFSSNAVTTRIPFVVRAKSAYLSGVNISSGEGLVFQGQADGSLIIPYAGDGSMDHLNVNISSEDWGKAMAGDYSATITFTAEVVSA